MPFPLPNVGTAGQPFQFAIIPQSGATPAKLFLKNTTAAYVYDGTSVTEVTDVDYPALTVPGVVYLDGTIYVMDPAGIIWGSDLSNPLSWSALNFISANADGDAAVMLARHLNYVVAFKERTTEFLYNAGAPAPGSPLGKMQNAFMEIGCAVAGSVASSDNSVYFMSKSASKGRSISKMEGFTPRKISTPFIDRILNADDLATVRSFVVKLNGHVFYVLTLVTSNLTLVFDEVTSEWHRWTSMTLGAAVNVTGTTTTDGVTTIPSTAHGLEDGDPIRLINQILPISYVDANTFTVVSAETVPANTSYNPYTESYFIGLYYAYASGEDLVLTGDGAAIYKFSTSTYQDNGMPIDVRARTAVEDFGEMKLKIYRRLELVGDIENTDVNLRWTDDDYQTWSLFRPIPVDANRAQLRMLGASRRRAFEMRHIDNTALRKISIELDIDLGAR